MVKLGWVLFNFCRVVGVVIMEIKWIKLVLMFWAISKFKVVMMVLFVVNMGFSNKRWVLGVNCFGNLFRYRLGFRVVLLCIKFRW